MKKRSGLRVCGRVERAEVPRSCLPVPRLACNYLARTLLKNAAGTVGGIRFRARVYFQNHINPFSPS